MADMDLACQAHAERAALPAVIAPVETQEGQGMGAGMEEEEVAQVVVEVVVVDVDEAAGHLTHLIR